MCYVNILFYSPCSGLILTVASQKNEEDTLVDTYLKNRMDDYKKFKKNFLLEKRYIIQNRNFDLEG